MMLFDFSIESVFKSCKELMKDQEEMERLTNGNKDYL